MSRTSIAATRAGSFQCAVLRRVDAAVLVSDISFWLLFSFLFVEFVRSDACFVFGYCIVVLSVFVFMGCLFSATLFCSWPPFSPIVLAGVPRLGCTLICVSPVKMVSHAEVFSL